MWVVNYTKRDGSEELHEFETREEAMDHVWSFCCPGSDYSRADISSDSGDGPSTVTVGE